MMSGWIDAIGRLPARPRIRAFLIFALLAWFAGMGAWAARRQTPTFDEFAQVPIGHYHWTSGRFDLDRRNPPLMKLLTAVPPVLMGARVDTDERWRGQGEGWWMWVFGTRYMRLNAERYFDFFLAARAVNLLLGVALGLCVHAWARSWLGPAPALGALLLYCTTPVILGHASLATLDIGVTFFAFAGFLALRRLARDPRPRWALASGALFGCALASKHTALFLLPAAAALLGLEWRAWRPGARGRFAAALALAALAGWLVLNATYFFGGFPLPGEWLDGIILKSLEAERGRSASFLLGRWSSEGWWYYYLVAALFKLTIPFLLLLAAAPPAFLGNRGSEAAFGLGRLDRLLPVLWPALPAASLAYALSFHYPIHLGIRYLLPALPFLVLIAGYGIRELARRGRGEKILLGGLLGWQLAAGLMAGSDPLAYFNETAGGPDRARRILLDSNLDWGQDLGRLKDWLDRRGIRNLRLAYFGPVDPRLYGISYTLAPTRPEPGLYAVSAAYLGGFPGMLTYLQDGEVCQIEGSWSWLDDYEPAARVGNTIYIFDLKQDPKQPDRLIDRPTSPR